MENQGEQLIVTVPSSIGDYLVDQQIGYGSFSRVYSASNQKTHEKLVIKVIPKVIVQNKEDVERLKREISIMQRVRHPNIVDFKEFLEDDQNCYLVMEMVKGTTLLEYINNSPVLPETQVSRIFEQICRAVHYLHRSAIAHRDLKLDNIMIDTKDTDEDDVRVKLLDFGFSNMTNFDSEMFTTYCGSLNYTSPEIINQQPYNGFAADIWSLGVILYAMATAELPWPCENMPMAIKCIRKALFSVPFSVSSKCSNLIKSILQLEPSNRPTIDEILQHPFIAAVSVSNSLSGGELQLSSKSNIFFDVKKQSFGSFRMVTRPIKKLSKITMPPKMHTNAFIGDSTLKYFNCVPKKMRYRSLSVDRCPELPWLSNKSPLAELE